MPYLFPHTMVPPRAVEKLLALFDEVTVLTPVADSHRPSVAAPEMNDRFKTVSPYPTGHDQVHQVVNAYLQWADQHRGIDLKQLCSQLDAPLFFDEESSYQLESFIRASNREQPSEKRLDPDEMRLNSRIFLCLAEAYDLHNWEMASNLKSVEVVENRLFAQLHGGTVKREASKKRAKENQTDYMIRERIEAWSYFLDQTNLPPGPLVTISSELIPLIAETAPKETIYYTRGWVPLYQDDDIQYRLRGRLMEVCNGWLNSPSQEPDLSELIYPQKPSAQESVRITVCRSVGWDPVRWIGQGIRSDIHQVLILVHV